MSPTFMERTIVSFSVWTIDATLILLLAWLITLCFRTRAALRHLVWVAGFSVALLAPVVSALVPAHAGMRVVVPVAMASPAPSESVIPAQLPDAAALSKADRLSESEDTFPVRSYPPKVAAPSSGLPHVAAWIWLAGSLLVLLQVGFAVIGARSMYQASSPGDLDSSGFAALVGRFGFRRSPRLRISNGKVPPAAMTWGVVRPVVLLPRAASAWPKKRSEVVLLHELAHVRRLDCLTQWLGLAVCTIFWFNPIAWLCAYAMRADSESAADDAVLRLGVRPSEYATELLSLAAELGGRRQPFASIGVSLMKRPAISSRIKSIVNPSHSRKSISGSQVGAIVAVGLLVAYLSTFVRPATSQREKEEKALYDYSLYYLTHRDHLRRLAHPSPKLVASEPHQRPQSHSEPGHAKSSASSSPHLQMKAGLASRIGEVSAPRLVRTIRTVPTVATMARPRLLPSAGFGVRTSSVARGVAGTMLAMMPRETAEPGETGASLNTLAVDRFTRIVVGPGIHLTFRTGRSSLVRVRGARALSDQIEARSAGGTLQLDSKSPEGPVNVEVESPKLDSLRLDGGASGEFFGIGRGTLEATVTGQSAAKVFGNPSAVRMEVSGSSSLAISGRQPYLIAGDVEGSSTLDVVGSVSGANLRLTGASSAKIVRLAASTFNARVDGASAITAIGHTKQLSASASGDSLESLSSLSVDSASVEVLGSSRVLLGDTGHLSVNAGGNSQVTYKGKPTVMKNVAADGSSVAKA